MRDLETLEYGALPLPTRLGILGALLQLALEGPSARTSLEGRLEEAARVRKAMQEDAKVRNCSPDLKCSFPSISSYAQSTGAALYVERGPLCRQEDMDSRIENCIKL